MNAEFLLNNATAALHHHNTPFQTTKNKRKLDDYEAELSSPKRFTDIANNESCIDQLAFPPFSPFDQQHQRTNFYPPQKVMPAITYASPDYRPPPPSNQNQIGNNLRLQINHQQQQQPTMVQDTDMGDSSGSDEEFTNLPTPAEYSSDSLERGWSQILYGQDQDAW
ncbi:hypothetical protein INT43_006603 [Umbelopsis isabellina]|uniref:Uncharacterized protein n=1 Tax=Mortierella isabellina TaxID=91625 RepID=A0A8H7Q024_MORIS|nr:hypothetical protein INT43_006603 [Umbelopsis isabellina]